MFAFQGSTSQLGLSVTATIACLLFLLVVFLGIKLFNKKKRSDPEPRTVNEGKRKTFYQVHVGLDS